MAFNVNSLSSALSKSGTAKSSNFHVEVTFPNENNYLSEFDIERQMTLRIDTAELPGRTITTSEVRYGNYGPISKVGYGQVYTDSTITVLCSEDLREKEFFELWQNAVINTGAFETFGGQQDFENNRSQSKFNARYYDNYIGTVTIRQFGEAGDLRSIHTLNEAYPIIVGGVPMNWSSEELIKLTVTFAYKNYRVVFNKSDQPGLGFGFNLRLNSSGVSASLNTSLGSINVGSDGNIAVGATNSAPRLMRKVASIL